MPAEQVRLIIDFRRFHKVPNTQEKFSLFWNAFENALQNKELPGGEVSTIRHPTNGVLGLHLLSPKTKVTVSPETQFEIVSLLDRPMALGHCSCCTDHKNSRPAVYVCLACEEQDPLAGCCEDHVALLEGGIASDGRIRTSCIKHAPVCRECGDSATFWCHGPGCRGKVPWCKSHLRSRQHQSGTGYCPSCFDLLFPKCSIAGCNDPGTNVCEHVDPHTLHDCGVKLCNRHIARWQIYGPTRIGLGRCTKHSSIRSLTDAEVVWQVVAGTARRHYQRAESISYKLPTLNGLAHVLRHSRDRFYDYSVAKSLYEDVKRRISGLHGIAIQMAEAIHYSSKFWPEEIKKRQDSWSLGLPFLENLKNSLHAAGLSECGRAVTHSSFIPAREDPVSGELKQPMLFIKLPEQLKSPMINKFGAVRNVFQEAAGCRVLFEKKELGT